jgi:hypothetical protein
MITPPTALPAAMAVVMTAKVQANDSVELAAGAARWTEALSDPSQGESGVRAIDGRRRSSMLRGSSSAIPRTSWM